MPDRKLWETHPCSLTIKHGLSVVSVNLSAHLPERLWEDIHRPRWPSPKLSSWSLGTGDLCQPKLHGCCWRKRWKYLDGMPSGWRWPEVSRRYDVERMIDSCLERLLRGSNRGEHKLWTSIMEWKQICGRELMQAADQYINKCGLFLLFFLQWAHFDIPSWL